MTSVRQDQNKARVRSKPHGIDSGSDEGVVAEVATYICCDDFTVYAVARHEVLVLSARRGRIRRRAASFSSRHLRCVCEG